MFGLGGPEVAIIAVAAAFLLGPSKLAEFSKDLGKVAGELKEVPKEVRRDRSSYVCSYVCSYLTRVLICVIYNNGAPNKPTPSSTPAHPHPKPPLDLIPSKPTSPSQFQKGIAEGEKEAKAIKANEMKPEKVEDVEVKEE